jgi:2-polyprenyl-3-methyl-5-hydroxy-6-metoxy-1,4-benzoquinol methylase
MDLRSHWESVYRTKAADQVSWYQPHLAQSMAFITAAAPDRGAAILDVGGGESTLVDDLLDDGYGNVTVLDISPHALEACRARLGERAALVRWIAADVTAADLPRHAFDVWHDRAVFHFLTDPAQRAAYVRQVTHAVKPGGHVIVATFAPDGPGKCSGLPVAQYDAASLHDAFGDGFRLVQAAREVHHTPGGREQPFTWCFCRLDTGRTTS